jgi:hypothetical protein
LPWFVLQTQFSVKYAGMVRLRTSVLVVRSRSSTRRSAAVEIVSRHSQKVLFMFAAV